MNGAHHGVDLVVIDNDLKFELLEEFDGEFRAAIALHLALLTAKTPHFAHGHAHDPRIDQGDLDVLELEGTNDGLNFFHRNSSGLVGSLSGNPCRW